MSEQHASFHVTVNDCPVTLHALSATGRQILSSAGLEPADDHVLVQVTSPGTRAIGLDEHVHANGRAEFHAFRNDRLYNFTIDGHGYVWGASKISEERLRTLSGIAPDRVLLLEHNDKPGLEIDEGVEIDLSRGGTEHMRSVQGHVEICFNGPERKIPRNSYTTEQLAELLGVENGYLLNVLGKDKQLRTLLPGERILVCKGHKFISQAPCGASS